MEAFKNKITVDHINNFINHVTTAHSWYKHLPLLLGGEFLIFIDPNPGEEYTEENLRMHYSWKHKNEYIERFGFLSYAWRLNEEDNWDCDYQLSQSIEESLQKYSNSQTRLYPYVSWEFREAYSIHEDDFKRIESGYTHPESDLLVKWKESYMQTETYWSNLSTKEMKLVLDIENADKKPDTSALSSTINGYIKSVEQENLLLQKLIDKEIRKIKTSIWHLFQSNY